MKTMLAKAFQHYLYKLKSNKAIEKIKHHRKVKTTHCSYCIEHFVSLKFSVDNLSSMVVILNGNSEIGAHVRSIFFYLYLKQSQIGCFFLPIQGSRKKIKSSVLVARPLRGVGGGGKGLATKKKEPFFEALRSSKNTPKKCGH